ncbi:MAG: PQQ-binding-like beta-propeller repeat protein [Candidatus Latescibacteria bacterium]|nr:PQQ-binding-like beta-propeller repeat protein [Candidatus Latescibacterota bacterium]
MILFAKRSFRSSAFAVVAALAFMVAFSCQQQPQRQPGKIIPLEQPDGEWRSLGRDLSFTRYSPLDQINAENVGSLEIAWRFKQENYGLSPAIGGQSSEATAIYVDGTAYVTAGLRRAVVAIDPGTGEALWSYRPQEDPERFQKAPRPSPGRGVTFWTDGKGDNRIYTVSKGFYLHAIDAETGELVESFGTGGVVDLMAGLRKRDDVDMAGSIGSSSPPTIVNDVIVVGPALAAASGFRPANVANTPGDVQAFDVKTGAPLWTFHTIPDEGETGVETWENDSWKVIGNTGVWTSISADPELGYVYLPVECPTNDYYGGQRPGDNLWANSLVCMDAKTGEMVWHYQIVHHDVWDYDNPAAPILADLTIDGQNRKIVIQNTKQGYSYVFDRVTGEPIWPIEEREVPQSDVPGERTSPTQPHPTNPAPWEQQGISEADLVDFTPAVKREAIKVLSQFRSGPLFTPASLGDAEDGTQGVIQIPGANGGVNWNMTSFDPILGVNYIPSNTSISRLALQTGSDESGVDFHQSFGRVSTRVFGEILLSKPPWGRITAIDMTSGDHMWMVANGDTPQAVKDLPQLRRANVPKTGKATRVTSMVTSTLLFAGEGYGGDPFLHAYDKSTGDVVASIELPAAMSGMPSTFMHDGKQYIVFTIGERGMPAEFVALTLPDAE